MEKIIPPRSRLIFNGLHSVLSQKKELFISGEIKMIKDLFLFS
jgi:hypothetical protein